MLDSEQGSDQYLKPRDVAAQLHVTVRTVRAWMAAGKLPSVLLSPRARRIRQQDLDRFLAARTQGGLTPADVARVAETRVRQGLPPTIRDPAFLAELAARVADAMVQARRTGGDCGAA